MWPRRTLRRVFHWWKLRHHVKDRLVTQQMEVLSNTREKRLLTRPLNSVSRARDQGNNVLFTQTGGWIINHETGWKTRLPRDTEPAASVRPRWKDDEIWSQSNNPLNVRPAVEDEMDEWYH